MKEEPLVSVIIPTYKRPGMLSRAIDSVLNQTYDNIEIIVVDDNDEDSEYRRETEEFMEKYADVDNLVYLKHKRNKGGSAARNTGIKKSQGDYISFLDDDDLWLDTKLEKQLKLFDKDKELGLVYCKMFWFENSTNQQLHKEKLNLVKTNIYKKMLGYNYINTSSVLVRKKCFSDIGMFDTSLSSRQDHDIFLRISKRFKIDYVDDFLIKYGVHQNKISRNLDNKILGWEKFLNKWDSELNKYPKAKKELYNNYYFEMAKLYYNNSKYAQARKFSIKLLKSDLLNLQALLIFILSFLKIDINLHDLKKKLNI